MVRSISVFYITLAVLSFDINLRQNGLMTDYNKERIPELSCGEVLPFQMRQLEFGEHIGVPS